MLRTALLLPPKRLSTPRSARRISPTSRGLLPGTPVSTRTGLTPAGLDQLAGRNMPASLSRSIGVKDAFIPSICMKASFTPLWTVQLAVGRISTAARHQSALVGAVSSIVT
jgi:hypothetical protein